MVPSRVLLLVLFCPVYWLRLRLHVSVLVLAVLLHLSVVATVLDTGNQKVTFDNDASITSNF